MASLDRLDDRAIVPLDEYYFAGPSWSPDGAHIASGNAGAYDTEPAWSKDGKLIAFQRWPTGSQEENAIFVMNADGSNERRLADGARTVNKDAATSPADDGFAYVANVDWTFFWSNDHLGSVTRRDVPPSAHVKAALAIAVDTVTGSVSDVYAAVGDERDNIDGEIYYNSDPLSASWTSTTLSSYTTQMTGGCPGQVAMRPLGVAVGRNATSQTVVIAAVDGCGLWQQIGGGTSAWSQVKGPSFVLGDQEGILQAPVVWPNPTAPYVYVLDRHAGALWRSNNYGNVGSWTRIWANIPSVNSNSWGYLAGDPSITGQGWLTTGESDGTYLLTHAHFGTLSHVKTTGTNKPVDPGPVAIAPGTSTAYVAGRVDASHTAVGFWKSTDTGANWTSLDTSTYRSSAVFPSNLDVSDDGYAYIPTAGQGVVVNSGV